MNTEYPPRHIKGFRPLVPGEAWHRTDWAPDMLPEGWRPRLKGELAEPSTHEVLKENGTWGQNFYRFDRDCASYCRTRRPLPPPPPTFEHDGKTWRSHVPGDPRPVDRKVKVEVLTQRLTTYTAEHALFWNWERADHGTSIIGYRTPDAEPQDETAKLRERIAELEQQLASLQTDYFFAERATDNVMRILPELNQSPSWEDAANNVRKYIDGLEQQLATALTPRPIAETGPVKEGFVRLTGRCEHGIVGFSERRFEADTHYLDIRLPEPNLRAEYDRAVAEAGGPFEAWLKAKGGAA